MGNHITCRGASLADGAIHCSTCHRLDATRVGIRPRLNVRTLSDLGTGLSLPLVSCDDYVPRVHAETVAHPRSQVGCKAGGSVTNRNASDNRLGGRLLAAAVLFAALAGFATLAVVQQAHATNHQKT